MTATAKRSFFQQDGRERHLPSNRSWSMKWFIICSERRSSGLSARWQGKSWPIPPRIVGLSASDRTWKRSSRSTGLRSSFPPPSFTEQFNQTGESHVRQIFALGRVACSRDLASVGRPAAVEFHGGETRVESYDALDRACMSWLY